jgi:ATP-dependent RNA helicase RhlE
VHKKDLSQRKDKLEMASFTELPLSPYVKERLLAAHFLTPTPVQEAAIPPALQGKDLLRPRKPARERHSRS